MRKLAGLRLRLPWGRHSVRRRLLTIALLPMLVILPLVLGVAIFRWNAQLDSVLASKAHDDLTIAHQYLGRILETTQDRLDATVDSARFQTLLGQGAAADGELSTFLKTTAQTQRLDWLYLLGPDGRILASHGLSAPEAMPRNWPVIASALGGRSRTALDVFTPLQLSAASPALAQRALTKLLPTANSAPTTRTQEPRGLVVQSASPVTLPGGRRGALVAGELLNRNLGFVDTINDLIYHGSGLPDGSRGTVTLFLDDVRISTNVRLFQDRRAIGTRVSAAVRDAVLGRGRTWLDSAFVVNDWYISGYEPLYDSYGRRVGMLYAGFLERPFSDARMQTLIEIALAFVIAVLATVPIFLRWAGAIFRPLEVMNDTMAKVEAGDLDARTGHLDGKDEIGRLAMHLDGLLDQLRRWQADLNQRVEDRTGKLMVANQRLEATTQQLIMSEKLAAIGEITAGIAHEINNPVAVMQGNLEVIRELMGPGAAAARTEFRLIDEQLRRIGEIVTRLLQFAKPQEYAVYAEEYDAAAVIDETLPLVQHLLKKTTITVEKEYRAARGVVMNRTELQQVLVNLMVNAVHAMPQGGRLTLRTSDRDDGLRRGVAIEVADTGDGMAGEVMQRIFDPFFTTKRREGTGLGLSISQMLINRQGGKVSVESEPGKGTVFRIWLPEVGL